MKFYGNESETGVVLEDGRIYLVQSVDTDQVEQLATLPENWEELDPALCYDLDLSGLPE